MGAPLGCAAATGAQEQAVSVRTSAPTDRPLVLLTGSRPRNVKEGTRSAARILDALVVGTARVCSPLDIRARVVCPGVSASLVVTAGTGHKEDAGDATRPVERRRLDVQTTSLHVRASVAVTSRVSIVADHSVRDAEPVHAHGTTALKGVCNMTSVRNSLLLTMVIALFSTSASLGLDDDFDLLESEIMVLFRSFQDHLNEESSALSKSRLGDWTKRQDFLEARKDGNWTGVIAVLEPIIEENPHNQWNLGAYEQIVNAYQRLGQQSKADAWGRKGAKAVEVVLGRSTNTPETLWWLQLHRRLCSGLSNYSNDDYQLEKTLCDKLLKFPQYKDWKDMIWDSLCDLEYSRGNYSEVLRICALIDDYYASLPASEKGRLMQDRWRARAMFKVGKKSEAIAVFENLARDRYAAIRNEVFFPEITEMRKSLAEDSAISGSLSSPEAALKVYMAAVDTGEMDDMYRCRSRAYLERTGLTDLEQFRTFWTDKHLALPLRFQISAVAALRDRIQEDMAQLPPDATEYVIQVPANEESRPPLPALTVRLVKEGDGWKLDSWGDENDSVSDTNSGRDLQTQPDVSEGVANVGIEAAKADKNASGCQCGGACTASGS